MRMLPYFITIKHLPNLLHQFLMSYYSAPHLLIFSSELFSRLLPTGSFSAIKAVLNTWHSHMFRRPLVIQGLTVPMIDLLLINQMSVAYIRCARHGTIHFSHANARNLVTAFMVHCAHNTIFTSTFYVE